MPNILAIDTATECCSVALLTKDSLIDRSVMDPQGHSRLVLEMIEEVLREGKIDRSDLDAISYDSGPGSFTGIRIGAGVAQGLALGLGKPLLGIYSLMILAQGVLTELAPDQSVLAAIDARMDQVYWGCLQRDLSLSMGWRWLEEPRVTNPEVVASCSAGCIGVGSGCDRYLSRMNASDVTWVFKRFPSARDQAVLANRLLAARGQNDVLSNLPVYLRNQVTQPSA